MVTQCFAMFITITIWVQLMDENGPVEQKLQIPNEVLFGRKMEA